MRVVFLGVGEACDERLSNTSIWVEAESGTRRTSILLDCGPTAPPRYWQLTTDPDDLDVLWISHFHGDHFFGVPFLLLRFWEAKRTRPLKIIGRQGIQEVIERAMDLAYPGFMQKLAFPVEYVTAEPGQTVHIRGLTWQFALNGHSQPDLAVRIDGDGKSLFYSGDGIPTPETQELAKGCDLIIHEAFLVEDIIKGHGNIHRCLEFAREAGAKALAIVHMQREERRSRLQDIAKIFDQTTDLKTFMPKPGDGIDLDEL